MFLGKKLHSENLFTENPSKIWTNTFFAGDFCEHLLPDMPGFHKKMTAQT